ncbi:hypothetical protein [Roseimaritima sediminicola]|uniref:hypothetical protein n=1 Tax=Roseimaritima sediminicola TaxID=2662066 RepID=UPI001298523B|nr:hypothetical protein [Roseimaritima sediminicola]
MGACFSRLSLAIAGILVVATCHLQDCHAQQAWPQPALPQPIVIDDAPPSLVRMVQDPLAHSGYANSAPQPPHLVLREHAPPRPPVPSTAPHHRHRGSPQTAHHWHEKLSHAFDKDRAHVTGPRASVPQATTQLRQKTPYSYGYFGARNQRHWSLHYGSRQHATRWTKH